jgi:very-short-patch-repair endonuclease
MTALAVDRAVEARARVQHGAFSRAQVLAVGGTKGLVGRRVRAGTWLRLDTAVYALASYPGTFMRQCWAAVLGSPGSAIAGLAAAAVWGLADYRPGRVELVVPRGGSARNRLAHVHRPETAVPTTHLCGLPITTISQTVFDIAGRSSILRLERSIDDALLGGRLQLSDLDERLRFYTGRRRPGVSTLRVLIDERREAGWVPPESELEATLVRVLSRVPGRPRLVRQHRFSWREAVEQRVDVWIPEYRAIVEGDGRRWHARLTDFDRDRWRDNEAVAHGLRPLRVTWPHLTACPDEIVDLVSRVGELALAEGTAA